MWRDRNLHLQVSNKARYEWVALPPTTPTYCLVTRKAMHALPTSLSFSCATTSNKRFKHDSICMHMCVSFFSSICLIATTSFAVAESSYRDLQYNCLSKLNPIHHPLNNFERVNCLFGPWSQNLSSFNTVYYCQIQPSSQKQIKTRSIPKSSFICKLLYLSEWRNAVNCYFRSLGESVCLGPKVCSKNWLCSIMQNEATSTVQPVRQQSHAAKNK